MTIGRGQEATVQVADESISRPHARIQRSRAHNRFSITDLNSRNGTFIDGRPAQSAPLRHCAVIRMGDTVAVADLDGLPLEDEQASPYEQLLQARLPQWRALEHHAMILGEAGVGKRRMAALIASSGAAAAQPPVLHCSVATDAGIFDELDAFSSGYKGRGAPHPVVILSRVEQLGVEAQRALLARLDAADAGQRNPVRCVSIASDRIPDMVRDGHFDRSLFHRLSHSIIELTPVRERAGEACRYLGARLPEFVPSADLVEAISLYRWPGNFNELAAVAEHLQASATSSLLDASLLPESMRAGFIPATVAVSPNGQQAATPPSIDAVSLPTPVTAKPSSEQLQLWLLACNGNVSALSRRMGKHRNQVVRWLASYGLPTGHIDFADWRRENFE